MSVSRSTIWKWIGALSCISLAAIALSVSWSRLHQDIDQLLGESAALMEQGEVARARHLLDSILRRDPTNATALLYRGELSREQGDLDGALADWGQVANQPRRFGSTARYLEATVFLELQRSRDAEEKLLRAIDLNPYYLQPHEQLLALYVLQRRREGILRQLSTLRNLRPLTLNELVLQLVANEPIETAEEAIPTLEAFVAADDEDIPSWTALARYYWDSGRHSEAVQSLEDALARHPQDDRIRGLLAEYVLNESGHQKASGVLAGHTPIPASPLWLWKSVGNVALATGDLELAAKCLWQVIRANPDDVTARYRMGILLQRLGHPKEGKQQLERVVLNDRMQRQALIASRLYQKQTGMLTPLIVEVGEILATVGRNEEALQWFAQALKFDPQEATAQAGVKRALDAVRSSMQSPAPQPDALPNLDALLASRSTSTTPPIVSTRESPFPAQLDRDVEPSTERKPIQLRDDHAKVGIDFVYFNGQTGLKYLIESMGGGATVLDYDVDGWPDLYFPQGCSLPVDPEDDSYTDRLYRNRGDGTFEDVTEAAGLGDPLYSQGCAAADFDNDGFPDLIIANYGPNVVYRNNGNGTFTDVTQSLGLGGEQMSSSVALADFDRDGDLDLYVANYVDSVKVCRNPEGNISVCDPENFDGEQDLLYLNRGDGTFEDVTATSGIVAANGKGLGVLVADLDDDGATDIYVSNDAVPNFLFRNVSGPTPNGVAPDQAEASAPAPAPSRRMQASHGLFFVEEGLISGAAVSGEGRSEAGMGIACADLNGDARLDLYVTNFYRETNTLYLNHGDALFVDATRGAGLDVATQPVLGFGTQAVDLDLDGDRELFVANGHIDDFQYRGEPWKMHPQLFNNRGPGVFHDVSGQSGAYFHGKYLGRGVARLDWNRDGRPDLVVVHQDAPTALLTNNTPETGHVLVLELHGVESNRDAVGAKIRISVGDTTQSLQICGGDGFHASNEHRRWVGLGQASQVDTLEIDWPSGLRDSWHDLPADSVLVAIEGREPIIRPVLEN